MKVNYPIEDHALAMHLNSEYGLEIEAVRFIPMGDSAYSYEASCTNGERYYLKLFDHRNERQASSMARLQHYLPFTWQLHDQGLFQNLTYPLRNRHGEFITAFNGFTVVVFNFIEGETLAEAYPFSEDIVEHIAVTVAAIHCNPPLIAKPSLMTENYDISFASDLEKCMSVLEDTLTFNHPIRQALRERVLPRKERILALLDLVRSLRGAALADTRDNVLCHGDLWGGNLILHDNELHVLDWESAMLAPPELDLVGYIGKEFEVFWSAYEQHIGQPVTLNPDLLRFYAYRHHLRNLTNWIMNILYRNTEETQNENDLDMIMNHCMNRWESIESKVEAVEAILQKRNHS
ncbi:aminoglycoside phosphotransferase family protein [Paenibacillus rhizovicinus]|uniref:Aminoglycoside phosphotransferase family protein n=1 Tax=Paenibacillus rhizovicinus TaxID=2704463 RepID=A0A6C0P5P6_9BACL|nr:aminoglycoside phosphotransferase family protein [Paenibacillus rhizovicinus]QHW33839.1 aminoglycoside phosphotransferase family protein [Paenibacillus rhizovicinus]